MNQKLSTAKACDRVDVRHVILQWILISSFSPLFFFVQQIMESLVARLYGAAHEKRYLMALGTILRKRVSKFGEDVKIMLTWCYRNNRNSVINQDISKRFSMAYFWNPWLHEYLKISNLTENAIRYLFSWAASYCQLPKWYSEDFGLSFEFFLISFFLFYVFCRDALYCYNRAVECPGKPLLSTQFCWFLFVCSFHVFVYGKDCFCCSLIFFFFFCIPCAAWPS